MRNAAARPTVKRKGLRRTEQSSQFANSARNAQGNNDQIVYPRCPPTAEQLLERNAPAEILKDIRKEERRINLGHLDFRKSALVSMYSVAVFLRETKSAWIQFSRHPDWDKTNKKPRANDRREALRFVTRFATGTTGKGSSKRASRDFKRLEFFWNKNATVSEVDADIRQNGLGQKKMDRNKQAGRRIVRLKFHMRHPSDWPVNQRTTEELTFIVQVQGADKNILMNSSFRTSNWSLGKANSSRRICNTLFVYC